MKKYSDIISGAVLFVLAAVYYAMATQIKQYNSGLPGIVTSDFIPKVYGIAVMVLSAILILFVSYLTVSGAIAGTADAATVKAAKFTMSSMVPVVGGILSDAAETVLASAGLPKNAVGVFGMLVVLGMCVAPFLQLGIHYLVYKLTAALSATVSGGRVAGLIDQIGGAFGLVLGMTGACALLLLISMVSAVTAATGG